MALLRCNAPPVHTSGVKSSPADDIVYAAKTLRKQTKSLQRRERRKCAKNGPEQVQQGPSTEIACSITSSSRESSVGLRASHSR
jgi:hypothetical protein